jgi:hypothetical protein
LLNLASIAWVFENKKFKVLEKRELELLGLARSLLGLVRVVVEYYARFMVLPFSIAAVFRFSQEIFQYPSLHTVLYRH